VYFAQDDTGKTRNGPCQVISWEDPDIAASKIYFADDFTIQVHQFKVQLCPASFPLLLVWK